MKINEKLKAELDRLSQESSEMLQIFQDQKKLDISEYQNWYTLACKIVKELLFGRSAEFEEYYVGESNIQKGQTSNLGIKKFLNLSNKFPLPPFQIDFVIVAFENQIAILRSISRNIDSILFDLDSSIYYEYQDDELEAAKIVLGVNVRAAGALCGVVIEKHLKRMLANRNISCRKANPGINDLSQLLKDHNIVDMITWRRISYCADIRNLCDHVKEKEPTIEDVQSLIDGTDWLIKTIN